MYDEPELDYSKLKYVLYARKSTDDPQRQLRSIPDQIDECQRYAERLGLKVATVLTESKSAKQPDQRPVFTRMLLDIRKGKYDGILAWHPDRLARNMKEGGEVIDMVDDEALLDLKFVTYTFTPDANGKMLLGMAFVLSKQYSDNLSQNVRRGVRKAFAEGKTPTFKHGYKRDADGLYRPDGSNFELMQEAWKMRKQNASLHEVAQHMNEGGYMRTIRRKGSPMKHVPMSDKILTRIFKDPFYYGVLVQASQQIDLRELYRFEPTVSEEDFFTIQRTARKSTFHTKRRIGFYPLKGMLKCAACGRTMVIAPSTSGSTTKKRYLFCRCDNPICREKALRKKRSCRTKHVFKFIYDFLEGGLNLTEAEYKRYYARMSTLSERQREQKRTELHRKQGLLKRAEKEISERSLKIIDYDKNDEVYKRNRQRIEEMTVDVTTLKKEIVALQKQLADPDKERLSLEQFLNLSKNAATKVKYADAVGKDVICRLIFLNLSVGDNEIVSYELREPFKTLLANRKNGTLSDSRGAGN